MGLELSARCLVASPERNARPSRCTGHVRSSGVTRGHEHHDRYYDGDCAKGQRQPVHTATCASAIAGARLVGVVLLGDFILQWLLEKELAVPRLCSGATDRCCSRCSCLHRISNGIRAPASFSFTGALCHPALPTSRACLREALTSVSVHGFSHNDDSSVRWDAHRHAKVKCGWRSAA